MAPLVRVTWLGTSSGLPTRQRDVSCLVVEVGRRLLLLDAGEGAQLSLLRRGFNLSAIEAVLVTHRHGDHTFGLPGLYGTLWLMGRPLPTLVGDQGVVDFLAAANRHSCGEEGDHPVVLLSGEPVDEEVLHLPRRGDTEIVIRAGALSHRVPSYGFRVEVIRHHSPRVKVEALRALGVDPGPVYGRLQQGEDVDLPDGRRLDARDLRLPGWREIATFTYLTDTRYCPTSVALARGADLVSHEATFLVGQEARALELGHSTIGDALRVFEESGAHHGVLTHFSARHPVEAYSHHLVTHPPAGRVTLAYDGLGIDLERGTPWPE